MNKTVRWAGIIGLGVLTLTMVAAAQLFHDARPVDAQSPGKAPAPSTVVYCTGKVDVEPAMQQLFPQQPGAVIEVYVKDGDHVRAGTPLVKINDEPFAVKEAEAEIAIRIAESQVAQAKQGLAQHAEQVKGLEAAVVVARQAVIDARQDVAYLERQLDANPRERQAVEDGLIKVRAKLAGTEATVKAKEAELQAAIKGRPANLVKTAEENVALNKAKLEEAREARRRCVLTAPVDGTVLRVDVARGTVFGPQSHTAAVIFAPQGEWFVRLEVDQEYAYRIAPAATAMIHDESNQAHKWAGEVARVGDAYLPPRPGVSAPTISMTADTPKLEVIVKFKNLETGDPRIRLGQRMTVRIDSAEQQIPAARLTATP